MVYCAHAAVLVYNCPRYWRTCYVNVDNHPRPLRRAARYRAAHAEYELHGIAGLFASVDPRHTRVRFTHLGWGDGDDWDAAFTYFDKAWSTFVLPHFVHRFEKGPIDWTKLPMLAPVAATLKLDLVSR